MFRTTKLFDDFDLLSLWFLVAFASSRLAPFAIIGFNFALPYSCWSMIPIAVQSWNIFAVGPPLIQGSRRFAIGIEVVNNRSHWRVSGSCKSLHWNPFCTFRHLDGHVLRGLCWASTHGIGREERHYLGCAFAMSSWSWGRNVYSMYEHGLLNFTCCSDWLIHSQHMICWKSCTT